MKGGRLKADWILEFMKGPLHGFSVVWVLFRAEWPGLLGEQLWSAKQRQRNCFKSCSTWNRTILTTNPHVTGMAWDDRSTDWFIFLIDYYGMMPGDMIIHEHLTIFSLCLDFGELGRVSEVLYKCQWSVIGGRSFLIKDNKSSLIQLSILSFPDEGLACLPSKTWASIIMLAITPVKASWNKSSIESPFKNGFLNPVATCPHWG